MAIPTLAASLSVNPRHAAADVGRRALQTLTTTAASSSQSGESNTNGDDNNNNSSLFGGSGSAPLVPAFILTGFLMGAILLMTWWRRVARPAGARMPFARVGGHMFYFPPAAAFEGPARGEKELGPRPEMFEVRVKGVERKVVEEKEGVLLEDVQPLSARYEPPPKTETKKKKKSNSNDLRSSTLSPIQKLLHRGRTEPPIPQHQQVPEQDSNTPLPPGRMHISVFIAMPSPSRPRSHNTYGDRRSSETVETMDSIARAKGKSRSTGDGMNMHDIDDDDDDDENERRVDDLDLMLGFTTASFRPVRSGDT